MQFYPLSILLVLAACNGDPGPDADTGTDSESGTDNGTDSDSDTESSSPADFHTPDVIVDRLDDTRTVSWSTLSGTPADLTRFSWGPGGTTDLFLVVETNDVVDAAVDLETGMTGLSTDTAGRLLSSMFKLVAVDGGYRIMSTKHAMFGLDVSGDEVVFSDVRSLHRSSNAGYLVFTVVPSGDAWAFTASARHVWDSSESGFVTDDDFEATNVVVDDGALVLSSTSATPLTLWSPPLDFDLPVDFNPGSTARVSNAEFLASDEGANPLDNVRVSDTYATQIATRGPDSATTIAAEAMLDEIVADLAAGDASMRYPKDFYLAFREGMLARTLVSADTFDGDLGQLTVPYVYFTNETDDDGVHHPFMVITSYGLPDSLTLLWDVPQPPGDGLSGQYPDQDVTRIAVSEALHMKIPMRDYGEVSSLGENTMVNDLASDGGVTQYDHHNYASVSATGVAIDGVVIYPSYNNTLSFAQSVAELSSHGMHSGRGLGAHYHADAHSAGADGLTLYNAGDYAGHTHPPIVSIGFDGVAGYGVYVSGDTASDGVGVALDDYAGHQHGDYGYHYHSVTSTETSGGQTYTAHMLPPRGAWSGRINDIPEFWDGPSPNYVGGGRDKWLGTE